MSLSGVAREKKKIGFAFEEWPLLLLSNQERHLNEVKLMFVTAQGSSSSLPDFFGVRGGYCIRPKRQR